MIIKGLDSDDLKLVNMEMHELYIRRQKIKADLKELDEIIALTLLCMGMQRVAI